MFKKHKFHRLGKHCVWPSGLFFFIHIRPVGKVHRSADNHCSHVDEIDNSSNFYVVMDTKSKFGNLHNFFDGALTGVYRLPRYLTSPRHFRNFFSLEPLGIQRSYHIRNNWSRNRFSPICLFLYTYQAICVFSHYYKWHFFLYLSRN